ncbi:hypothetical protein ACQVP2_33760 [Methylobacterium aquaticum]|uniref:hypothetical protein n=1 Tax=Methylobacterium aquaticum TaxID=270351 RepID=UPI003D169B9C
MRYAAKVAAVQLMPAGQQQAALLALRAAERAELDALKVRELARRYAAANDTKPKASPPQPQRPIKVARIMAPQRRAW